ncbi:hypothetical protein PVT68_00560 [Microbulbifer bruguierae]|uniref:Uncharacterized protein n=1 Tax=Microbulbifer bruguierae TaxID=3029061 RepID=A0ABY8ND17_9GAMM|nr:hypothetical protein [Microbulbifer bruguierae]WGL16806.1 hypothetical protein PVT68_00560 [Microbulbifer bruguierae]
MTLRDDTFDTNTVTRKQVGERLLVGKFWDSRKNIVHIQFKGESRNGSLSPHNDLKGMGLWNHRSSESRIFPSGLKSMTENLNPGLGYIGKVPLSDIDKPIAQFDT